MCLHSVCCLLSAWSRDNESLNRGWVQAGTRPVFWYSCVAAFCHSNTDVTCEQRQQCAPCNLEPKADFLNCRSLCLFVPEHELFLQKAPFSFVWNNKEPERSATNGFDILAPRRRLVLSLRWEVDCEWLKFGRRMGGEIWFCPPLISCKESWRKNKRWAARNNVVLSRAQLIVLILLLQACHVPPAAWME